MFLRPREILRRVGERFILGSGGNSVRRLVDLLSIRAAQALVMKVCWQAMFGKAPKGLKFDSPLELMFPNFVNRQRTSLAHTVQFSGNNITLYSLECREK